VSKPTKEFNLGNLLQAFPRRGLFLLLFLAATLPLFTTVTLPNKPWDDSIDFYKNLVALQPGDKVLIGSDWTLGTRAESGGEFEALIRILIRRQVKFALYSTGDVQAPLVARDAIATIAKDEAANGQKLYKPFEDYVICGFFPNSEGETLAINNNVRGAFSGRKDYPENGPPQDVLQSPVFQGIRKISDFKYLVLVTPSNTERITFQRVKDTKLMFMVTGVMFVEDHNYYASGQLKGLIGGVKGVFDLETIMSKGYESIPPLPGKNEPGRGTKYYPALHACLGLLLLAVIAGNVGMWLSRKGVKS
jgi:hypothetical protein